MSDNSKMSSKSIKPGKKKVTIQSDKHFGNLMQDPKDSTNNTDQHNMSSFQQYPEVLSYQQSKGLDAFQYRIGNEKFEANPANEIRSSVSEAQGLDEWKREMKLETGKKSNSMKILRMNHLNSLKYDYKFPDIDSDIVDSIVRYPEPVNPVTQTVLQTQGSLSALPIDFESPQNKQLSMENLSTPRKNNPGNNKLKRGESLLVQLQQPSFNTNAPPKILSQNQPQVQSSQLDENYFLPLNSNLKKIDYNQTFESLQRAVNKEIVNDLLVRRIRRAYTREESSVGASPQSITSKTERKITAKLSGNSSDGYADMNQFPGKQEYQNSDSEQLLLKQKMKTTSGWWNRKITINGSTGFQTTKESNLKQDENQISSAIRINHRQQQKGAAGCSFTSLSGQKYVEQQDNYSQEQLRIQQAKQRRVDEAFKNEISRFSLRTLGSFKHLLHSFKKSSNLVDYQDIHRQLIQQISIPTGIQFSLESHGNQPYGELDRVSNDQSYFFRQTEKSLREHNNTLKSETEKLEVNHLVLRLKRHDITDKLYANAQEIREIMRKSFRYEKQPIKHSSTRAILSQNKGKFVKVITKKPPEDELKSLPTQEQEENLKQLRETKEELELSLSAVERELDAGEEQLKRIKEKKEVTRQMMKELYTESLRDATLSSKQNLIDTVRALLEINEDITKQKELLPSFLDKESQKYILKIAGLENNLDHLETSLKSNESENDPARTQANKQYDQSYFRMQKKFKLQDVKAKIQKMAISSILKVKKKKNNNNADIMNEDTNNNNNNNNNAGNSCVFPNSELDLSDGNAFNKNNNYNNRVSSSDEGEDNNGYSSGSDSNQDTSYLHHKDIAFSVSKAPDSKRELVAYNQESRTAIEKIKNEIIELREQESNRLIQVYLSEKDDMKLSECRQVLTQLFGQQQGEQYFKIFLKKRNINQLQISNSHTFTFQKIPQFKKLDADQVGLPHENEKLKLNKSTANLKNSDNFNSAELDTPKEYISNHKGAIKHQIGDGNASSQKRNRSPVSVPEEAMERFKEMKRLVMMEEDSGKDSGDSTRIITNSNQLKRNDKAAGLKLNLSAVDGAGKTDRSLGRPRENNLTQLRAQKDHSADAFRGTTFSFPTPTTTTGRDKRSNTEHAGDTHFSQWNQQKEKKVVTCNFYRNKQNTDAGGSAASDKSLFPEYFLTQRSFGTSFRSRPDSIQREYGLDQGSEDASRMVQIHNQITHILKKQRL